MLKRTVIVAFSLFLCVWSCAQESKTQNQKSSKQAIPGGSLLIMGGGELDTIFTEVFALLAGGKDAPIVIIPTAAAEETLDPLRYLAWMQSKGFTNVNILHTRNREVANSKEFVKPLKKAMGVWITGGRQWRLSEAYLNTQTHTELNKLLRRGGIVAGSSAGATIQGSVLVRGAKPNNTTMLGEIRDGFSFLENVGIDQHLLARNRQFDMFEVLKEYPNMLGIGIDENTGILVQDNKFKVLGKSYVAIYDGTRWSAERDQVYTLEPDSKAFYFLKSGEIYDIKKRKVLVDKKKK